MGKKSFLIKMLEESKVYNDVDTFDKLVESSDSLEFLPIQPIYSTLRKLSFEEVGLCLVKLSAEQRNIMLNIDLWKKDDIDPEEFEFWVKSYFHSNDLNLLDEFTKSSEFLLYLKSRFNIWTFDIEDPQYPDHDNYFLTDDNLLLFEFDDKYNLQDEVKKLVQGLYSNLGVDKAYSLLFKYVSEGHYSLVEEEYRLKKNKLEDVGFVDYFDSLQIYNCFPSLSLLDNFIDKKVKSTGELTTFSKLQVLDSAVLKYFKEKDTFENELLGVSDLNREEYLRFNFIRLVNGTLSFKDLLKEGSVVKKKVFDNLNHRLELGINYIKSYTGIGSSVFDQFDCVEVFKVGNSLTQIKLKQLKRAFGHNKIECDDEVVGEVLRKFLDGVFSEELVLDLNNETRGVNDLSSLSIYNEWMDFSQELLPFIKQVKNTLDNLKNSGQINNNIYLNYAIEEIDLESILISSFANFSLGIESDQFKMGIKLVDLKKFISLYYTGQGDLREEKNLENQIGVFLEKLGLSSIQNFSQYIKLILNNAYEGISFEDLTDDEYKHIAGAIIFSNQKID